MNKVYALIALIALIAVIVVTFIGCTMMPGEYSAPELTIEEIRQGREQRLQLWYREPAEDWMTEALPIGNGYLGAMVFGGVDRERIQFNEESLWTGGEGEWADYRGGNREGAYKHLPEVRKLLDEGDYKAAHKLARRELTGVIKASHGDSVWEGFGAYQNFGDLYIDVARRGSVESYRRQLALDKGTVSVTYSSGEVAYKREYFASYPRRALVMRLSSDAIDGSDYTLRQVLPHSNHTLRFKDNTLIINGKLDNNGMGYESQMLVEADGGSVQFIDGEIRVNGASSLTLYLTAATDYVNDYPHYSGRDYVALNEATMEQIRGSDFEAIKAEHEKDFGELFNRVDLDLDQRGLAYLPTDQRLDNYKMGAQDNDLEALYFQYGRYLLISSSRPGSLPANLQGKWNDSTAPKWASDYHANINIQMIYWLAEVGNLSEVHAPLIDYIDKLRAPGRVSAKDYFNAQGWIVNVANNPFGYTAPGWDLPWGFFPSGAAWYGRHVWEHYDYNRDEEYLRRVGYPVLRETALFWLDALVADSEGHLSSSPSYSPEHGTISAGATMDVEIVWDLFTNTLAAADVLGIDDEFVTQVREARQKLLPLQIGRWGQLQEWKEDVDDPDSHHRHISHLYALYPGQQVNLAETPELAEAAHVSLAARGDEGTGWSIGWKINFWARLLEGEHAYKMVRRALQRDQKPSKLDNLVGLNMLTGGGVYGNLLSTHPPFQLDGNMGAAAGIAEMLLQSHEDAIRLLPALPTAWKDGSVSGLKARGNAAVSMVWRDGSLTEAEVVSPRSGRFTFLYAGRQVQLDVLANQPMAIKF